jgi:two-component system catabolic regulation response regulator CreB
MPLILIVDDEPAIAEALAFALERERFDTRCVTLGSEALAFLRAQPADLVVLDIGLPDMSGFDVCRELRRANGVPVLFLSARGEEIDRVLGLELGADDYVAKPFSPREVVARIRSILRRAGGTAEPASASGAFAWHAPERRILYHGQPLALTKHEYELLACLLAQPRRVFSREQLLAAAGVSTEAGYERNVDTHVKALRAKLRAIAPSADPIRTHRGVGYSLEPGAG